MNGRPRLVLRRSLKPVELPASLVIAGGPTIPQPKAPRPAAVTPEARAAEVFLNTFDVRCRNCGGYDIAVFLDLLEPPAVSFVCWDCAQSWMYQF